ncbi:FAD-dependent oxidoreductase [Uniformispora flossi]|uniref:FAD-dependent oxidoreductase n=1 Tax=Uniformispora flossi TaxID=3390723 RepID=UPI003C2E9B42
MLRSAGTLDPADPDALTTQLRRVFPEARVVEVACNDWNADPYARGARFAPKPGQWALPTAFLEPHGRVVFAGGNLSPTSLGYMDGAVVSGRAAVERIREVLGARPGACRARPWWRRPAGRTGYPAPRRSR